MKKTVIFDAESFCFGPVSGTMNVVREMKKMTGEDDSYEYALVGNLTTLQLSKLSSVFDRIIECNTNNYDCFCDIKDYVSSAAAYVSNMNFNSIKHIHKLNIATKCFFIDTLFWMWDKPQIDPRTIECYFIQDFLGTDSQFERLGIQKSDVKLVGPLINTAYKPRSDKENKILINLGGIENLYQKEGYFVEPLVDIIIKAARKTGLLKNNKVIITGGGKEIVEIENKYKSEGFFIGPLEQEDFLFNVSTSRYFLTLPGLATFYESTYCKNQSFMLLPQNYSQFGQFETYKRYYHGIRGTNWTFFDDMPKINEHMEELAAIERVRQCNQDFFNSREKMEIYENIIADFLNEMSAEGSEKKVLGDIDKNFRIIFGAHGETGSETIAKLVLETIK